MESAVCHKGTDRVPVLILAMGLVAGAAGWAQSTPDWRKVGGQAVQLSLASPATGPVERVWYAPDGAILYARTSAGKTFQTSDFETWNAAENANPPELTQVSGIVRAPEPGSTIRYVTASSAPYRIYSLGKHISRTDDGGRSWSNLTSFRGQAVIGGGQRDLAVSPTNADQLVVANGYGVWRSMDGGLTWAGLNQRLPNLPVRRILSTQSGTAGTRAFVQGVGAVELPPGQMVWQPAPEVPLPAETAQAAQYSQALQTEVTAFGQSSDGSTVYVGAGDGRLWVSRDAGRTFNITLAPAGTSGRVERIIVDGGTHKDLALAVLSGPGVHVLRTTNGGRFWDSLDGSAEFPAAYAVAADWTAGAVYVATEKGVFYSRADLENAATNPVSWQNLTDKLPAVRAIDVRLDPAGVQLYIALDGYGLWAALAPHRMQSVRVVNTADYSLRPAAPGSLLSVFGARVNAAAAGGLKYPVLVAQDTQSQIQVPFDAVGPSVNLALETAAGSIRVTQQVLPVSPAILVSHDGVPELIDADTNLPVDSRNAAHSNGRIKIMATGLGKVRPEWPAGQPAPMLNSPVVIAGVRAFLDGVPLQVTKAALAGGYVGFYEIEVQLPAITNAGTSELKISADGQESNKVQIVIEP
jgi:uncharacterized protein (TIGR03437 family)